LRKIVIQRDIVNRPISDVNSQISKFQMLAGFDAKRHGA